MSESCKKLPWKDGYYSDETFRLVLYHIDGNVISRQFISEPLSQKDHPRFSNGTLRYGDFGEADQEVTEKSGLTQYNVQISMPIFGNSVFVDLKATLSDDGENITFIEANKKLRALKWISEKDLIGLKNSGDPADALPTHYEIQNPDKPGKLIWISGGPGLGKSTSGLVLAKKFGYVYYEADAFMSYVNPYVPLNVEEPTLATAKQNFLKDVPQERVDAVVNGVESFMNIITGKEYDLAKCCGLYSFLCKDIVREQKRIGGDWVVAQAVPSRKLRDHIRTRLGDNLIFVVLDMSKEDQLSRIKSRHGNSEKAVGFLSKCYDYFEVAGEDEPRAINVVITKDMTRDDVVEKILLLVNAYEF